MDENDLRALQPLVPKGTRNRLLQFLMTAHNGALSKFLTSRGIPYQYPHLVELANYFSFTMPPGEKHDTMRAVYASPVTGEKIKQRNYEGVLTEGAGRYLDAFPASESLVDVAKFGRSTVVTAMAD